ncbi:esterase B1-like [Contarinia nasturtii]|uniref:esterase B1-like n=1 Tax=Contarinia nasturtii TaxID=265458 RepID=UPI0012D39506|nr:esterase B1-like [Contarinia nasturtii]
MLKLLSELMRIAFLMSAVQCDELTIRKTNNGPVEGIKQTSLLGKKYYAFRGIPYAEAPITGKDPYTGAEVDRRFKAPEPLIRKWTDPLKVRNFGYNCVPSSTLVGLPGNTSENCLFLNIYVPDGGAAKKTVLVYFYGGAFTEGSGHSNTYGPDFLIHPDNIVVTLNYRTGIFGFMNLGFGEYTGNMGLKDQQLAMKWIYENIEHFSGKKDEILLFGQSAGGASVNFHMLNEESRKYFNRAFLLSSSALNYYALYEPDHLERMQTLLKIQDKNKLIEHLKTVETESIAKIIKISTFGLFRLESPWVPTIENSEAKRAFITKSPVDIYQSKNAPVMDTMFSFTSEEYLSFNRELASNTEPFLSGNWNESQLLLPFAGFDRETYPKEYKEAFDLLKKTYYNETSDPDVIKSQNIALLSDLNFGYGILKAVQYQVKANNKENSKKNTFMYRFSVNGDINIFKILLQIKSNGAAHGDEICYLFGCHAIDFINKIALIIRNSSNVNYNTIMRLVNIVTNFARTGNPSIEGDTPFKPIPSPNEIFAQDITNDLNTTLISDVLQELHFDTWKQIEEMYNKIKQNA